MVLSQAADQVLGVVQRQVLDLGLDRARELVLGVVKDLVQALEWTLIPGQTLVLGAATIQDPAARQPELDSHQATRHNQSQLHSQPTYCSGYTGFWESLQQLSLHRVYG